MIKDIHYDYATKKIHNKDSSIFMNKNCIYISFYYCLYAKNEF